MTDKQPRMRVGPITGLDGVVTELKRIYSETRCGQLDSSEAM